MEDALPALLLAYGLSRLAFRLRSFCEAPLSTAAAEVAIRQRLEDQVQRMVSTLIEARRPDVIFLGREIYAACVASISIRRQLPFVQRLPGATTHGILDGQYPPELGAAMLDGYRAAEALVSPGRHLADLVRVHGIDRVVVIPTAIDLGQFTPRPKDDRLLQDLGIPAGAVVVGHVSNLKPVKRPLDVVQSAVETTRRDARLIYLIIGDGPLRERMEEACRQGGFWIASDSPGGSTMRRCPAI